jgi:Ribonuclease G/E
MSAQLLVSALPGELRAALVWADGRLQEVVVRRAERPQLCGALFLGRVLAIDRGLQAAFLELGSGPPGFLPLKHCPGKALHEGARLAVRAISEPPPGKGPKLTALLSKEENGAAQAAVEPGLIRRGTDALDGLLANPEGLAEIVVDRAETLRDLRRSLPKDAADLLRHDPDPRPLFERAGLEAEIEALLHPEVPLAGGGGLRVEPVPTLVAVDVDSGGADGRVGADAQALAVDLAAAEEIPRQLRLRGLGGLVAVDFLEIESKARRQEVVERLAKGFQAEEAVQLRPMSPGGLVELSRRRLGPSLADLLTQPTGIGGLGRRKTAVTLAYEALRGILAALADAPERSAGLRARLAIVHALETQTAPARREVEARIGRPIELVPLEEPEVEDYEIVLG